MTDSLKDLFAHRQSQQPPEIQLIQTFVHDRYQVTPGVKLSERSIVIIVPSAGLAGALRPELHVLKAELATDKQLIIRIQ